MNDAEKVKVIKAYIVKNYDPDFDFEIEHWENGNYDDSYEYGCKSGKQDIINVIKNILEK